MGNILREVMKEVVECERSLYRFLSEGRLINKDIGRLLLDLGEQVISFRSIAFQTLDIHRHGLIAVAVLQQTKRVKGLVLGERIIRSLKVKLHIFLYIRLNICINYWHAEKSKSVVLQSGAGLLLFEVPAVGCDD